MFSMRIEGGRELAEKLAALPDVLQRKLIVDALKQAAEPMRARMAQMAPRGTGLSSGRDEDFEHLADNIVVSVANRLGSVQGGKWTKRDETEHAVAVGPQKSFFYGLFQEYGTSHHAAQPFMRPALDSSAGLSMSIATQVLWDAIRKRAGRTGMGVGSGGLL